MTISFLLPGPSIYPAGGYKVIFEYANRLAQEGYKVNVVYAGSLFWRKKSILFKLSAIARYLQKRWVGFSSDWFSFHPNVQEHLTYSLNYRHVPISDIYICSTPFTAMYMNSYPIKQNSKFYFIQGYENWGGINDDQLKETYRFPCNKIAVSKWLADIVKSEGEDCPVIPNGFDFTQFKCSIPISERPDNIIGIVYSPIQCKGFKYGYEALILAHKQRADLKVIMFGTDLEPENLPKWITYIRCPDTNQINEIYNNISIFVAPSIQEGWGLTVGEAMICGAAVVCSNNKGYLEMSQDGITALVSPVCDSKVMASNILKLMSDSLLRQKIALNGMKNIKQFTIDKSFLLMKKSLGIK